MPARIACLVSGGGSNMEAIVAHLVREHTAGAVVLVMSNRPSAGALARAAGHGIAVATLADSGSAGEMLGRLREHDIDLVALAGYLKRVPAAVTEAFHGRMLNVHPALLPAFGGQGMHGRKVHAAVLDAGVRVTGVTVHFVDEQYDRGPIAAQWPVIVRETDTPETLGARVLAVEHTLYPRVLAAVATGRIAVGPDGRVTGSLTEFSQETDPFAL